MNKALQQYLTLYSENKDLICSKSAPGFNVWREQAYRNLLAEGLPKHGSENYEITDLAEMLAPDFGLNIARIPLDVNPADSFKCGLPHLSSALFFMLNDMWGESKGARNVLPEGVEIGPLSRYMQPDGEATEFYGKIADLLNPIVALNTMLVQEGLFLRVKKGMKVERPIQLVNIIEAMIPLMAVRRILLIVEEGAEIKLLSCDHSNSREKTSASLTVTEIFAAKGSRVEFYDMEENGSLSNRLSALYLRQEEDSHAVVESFTLHNGMTRNEFHCEFAGKGSSLKLYGLGIEDHHNLLDNYSRIAHNAGDCHTDELFKYIVEDEGRGAFTGRIYVAPGAAKTEAYQSNRNLVTSDRARMFSKPQLEIYNDDVKCSHGSATGQLDPMQLFYMRQRGLSDDEARLLLKQAFMADVIQGVSLDLLRDRLHNLVERRFIGQDLSCSDCEVCPK